MEEKIKLLHIEDSPIIAKLVKEMLASVKDVSVDIEHFVYVKDGLDRLAKGGVDIVLTDLQLPDSDGLNTFYKIYAEVPEVPIVVMTGTYEEEEMAMEALQKGAQEYLRKAEVNPDTLLRAIRYSIERQRIKNELKKVSDELKVYYKELKSAYADLKSTQDKLVQSEKLAGLVRFSEGIAHEVRNPLGIIIGGTEVLEKKLAGADEETRNFVDMIKRAAVRASDILKTFLVYSKSGHVTVAKENANDMLFNILKEFKEKNKAAGIEIIENITSEEACVEVDKSQIGEAITGILVNSIEAMPGGGSIVVKGYRSPVSASGTGMQYVIMVDDTGSGMPKGDLTKLFEPFFTTKERKREGAGRGLFTAKAIIESFGGHITVDSVEGKGTNVTIMLPCCQK